MNRPHPAFEILAGVVDTDAYEALVQFPSVATGPDGLYTLEKGTPIAQVLPFRRDEAGLAGVVRDETADEAVMRHKHHRLTTASEGWYRTEARAAR